MQKFLSKITAIAIFGLSITCVSMTTVNAQELQMDHGKPGCDSSITNDSIKCCQKDGKSHQEEYLIENHSPKHPLKAANNKTVSNHLSKIISSKNIEQQPKDRKDFKNSYSKYQKRTTQKNE